MILTELECSGRFRVVRALAEGEAASVYEAELLGAAGFSKRVALKVIDHGLACRPEVLQSLIAETKLAANLMHGNIVQIFQLGELGGEYFVTMEFIKGPTVRQVIDRHRELGRRVPPPLAAYIASRVCRALDYAHMCVDPTGQRLDIIHSGVNPSNVLATWDGHIKVADFGIARATGRLARVGAERYHSPEQRNGEALDARTDVYSLGLVLHELLASQPLATDEPIADQLRDLDPTLEYILRRALDQDPGRRPGAGLLAADLDRWIATQHTYGSPDRLQSHLAQLFPQDFSSAVWTEPAVADPGFAALERALRHNSYGRAGLLEKWFGR